MDKNKTYVSLETAKLLKKAGFTWECSEYYKNNNDSLIWGYCYDWNSQQTPGVDYVSAPTLEVAQKWLREVKNCQIEIMYMYDKYGINMGKYIGIYTVQDRIHTSLADEESEQPIKLFEVYEKAQEALEQKILTILLEEEQQNEESNLV